MMNQTQNFDCVIIGGGAAGFFAAANLIEKKPNLKVALLEAGRRPLTKVKVSGGGRCNVTHFCLDPKRLVTHYPRGNRELLGPFHHFGPEQVVTWFKDHHVALKTEDDGRMFPTTNNSQTIVDCLRDTCERGGVCFQTGKMVLDVNRTDTGQFLIKTLKGDPYHAHHLILTTGSSPKGHNLAEGLGHSIVSPVPSLFTFKISDKRINDLSGISFSNIEVQLQASKKKPQFKQNGPCVITHWGLSGPAVLRLSAFAARELHDLNYQAKIKVNWNPSFSRQDYLGKFADNRKSHPRKFVHGMNVAVPKRFWSNLLCQLEIPEDLTWANLKTSQIEKIVSELTEAIFLISGKGEFKEEFVTCGGVSRKEIDFKTMQSKLHPNLYFAGEVIDIDGVTGGFNFQNAWTTSFVAAETIAEQY